LSYYRFRNYRRRRSSWRSTLHLPPETSLGAVKRKAQASSLLFVRGRFFDFSPLTFEAFARFYTRKYGSSAGSYLRKTYSEWRSGYTGMSGQTATRILSCVPRFLSKEDQISLLKFYLPWFNNLKEADFSTSQVSVSNITEVYIAAGKYVSEQSFHLDWFIADVFSQEELNAFLEGFRYMLLKRLEISYQSVCRDLVRLAELLDRANLPVKATYHIDYLGCPISIEDSQLPCLDGFQIKLPPPAIFHTAESHLLKVLSEDVLEIRREQQSAQVNALISSNDMEVVLSRIKVGSGQEIDTRIEAAGEGGRFNIHFVRRDVRRLKYECSKAASILFGVCFLVVALTIHGLAEDYFGALICPFGIFILMALGFSWTSYSNAKKALSDYERQTPVRLTKN
jgi:hypothetical protein